MRKIAGSFVCLCLSAPAIGQNIIDTASTNIEYVDRVIASDQLPILEDENESEIFDATGFPRSWRLEMGAGFTDSNEITQHEVGISASGFFETADYGAWSFDIDANRNSLGQNVIGRFSVYQRGLILNNGWRMDNSLGMLGSNLPSLLRQQYRFVLPTQNFLGISSEASRADGSVLNAAIGRAGRRVGNQYSSFETDEGSLAIIGGQTRNGLFQTAASVVSSQDDDGSPQISALAAVAMSSGSNSAQANILFDDGTGNGLWIDGVSKPDRIEHRYGIFRFDPSLEWAGQMMLSDIQGVYYRAQSRQTRWSWSGGLDHVQSVSGAAPDINFFTSQGRYQVSSRWGIGGASSARITSEGTSTSLQAFLDQRTASGSARVQIDQARSNALRSEQITWDQSFSKSDGAQWTTKLGFLQQHDRYDRAGQEWSASIFGSRDFGSHLRWDGMLRYATGNGPLAQSGLEANLGLNWTITQSWSLSANYSQNQGRRDSVFNLDPLLVLDAIDENARSFYFTLRYEHRAGQVVGVLGGVPGSAAGSIVGEIYLDANADGRRNADEIPVADITVLLDGRYPARTDATGRFNFDRVAAGSHTLIAVSDNLPLPWQLPSDAKSIEVKVRDTARWSIGALQPTK